MRVKSKSKSQLQLIECAVRSFVVGDLNIKYRTDIGKQVGQCNILSRCQISGSFRFSFVYSFRFNQSQTPLFILPTFSTLFATSSSPSPHISNPHLWGDDVVPARALEFPCSYNYCITRGPTPLSYYCRMIRSVFLMIGSLGCIWLLS